MCIVQDSDGIGPSESRYAQGLGVFACDGRDATFSSDTTLLINVIYAGLKMLRVLRNFCVLALEHISIRAADMPLYNAALGTSASCCLSNVFAQSIVSRHYSDEENLRCHWNLSQDARLDFRLVKQEMIEHLRKGDAAGLENGLSDPHLHAYSFF